MTKRAYLTFSSKKHYVDELKQQEYVFETYSNFPKWLIDQLLSEVQLEHSNIRSLTQDKQNDVNKTAHLLVLPYAGLKDEKLIKSTKNCLKYVLPENVATTVTYSGTRLSSEFTMIKYETVNENHYDIVYYVKYPEDQCSEDYAGETARKLPERVLDHNSRGAKSYLVKDVIKKCHK